ncbi:primosome assembly protein PriA [Ornithinimicrobium sp. LYQ92]|uniref:primosomal protein N' family DNA-binding protein n=1 Tax=Serinicoccus sp. LYQ92 TaxID=3378798 RepID=UPI003852367B
MSEQLELVPPPRAPRRRQHAPAADVPLAATDPVARVLVDTPLAHLDRPFEYAVPAELDEQARPGVRVRVRFAGRDHDGYLLTRVDTAEHSGRLTPLRSVVSAEPVLTPAVAALARSVADHYGGTLSDTLRLAVPPRHARAERSVPDAGTDVTRPGSGTDGGQVAACPAWDGYPAGEAFLRRVRDGQAPAASWLALPGRAPGADWPDAIAGAVQAAVDGGRGAVVVLPDHRDVVRVLPVLEEAVGADAVVRLSADLGPEARYRAFLRALRGHAQVVVGTRASAFAPVRDLGLLVCWDEADDLHEEPRAPYPHVREVLRRRARAEGAALLLGGFTRSVAAQAWVEQGSVASVVAAPAAVRAQAPAVVVAGEGRQEDRDEAARTARIPSVAWRALRAGLDHGPVLVQVPRQGYVVALACQDCRTPVRCRHCQGPVGAGGGQDAGSCRVCGTPVSPAERDQGCPECGSTRRRASAVGERRTAEELGRAFPGVRVVSSGGEHVVAQVEDTPALVVATPGAEPWCPGGYAAVALLDGWRLLERASVEAQPEALRRWSAAAALVAAPVPTDGTAARGPRRRSAQVVLCGVPPHGSIPAVEALVRWDPVWLAARELAERRELDLPPCRRHASVVGPEAAVQEVLGVLGAAGQEVLGVFPEGARVRATVRESAQPQGNGLARAVHTVRAERSARKAQDAVRMMLDVVDGA